MLNNRFGVFGQFGLGSGAVAQGVVYGFILLNPLADLRLSIALGVAIFSVVLGLTLFGDGQGRVGLQVHATIHQPWPVTTLDGIV